MMPQHLPPNSYLDDPAENIDREESDVRDMAFDFASALQARLNEWASARPVA